MVNITLPDSIISSLIWFGAMAGVALAAFA
jgi:hypothetical protein